MQTYSVSIPFRSLRLPMLIRSIQCDCCCFIFLLYFISFRVVRQLCFVQIDGIVVVVSHLLVIPWLSCDNDVDVVVVIVIVIITIIVLCCALLFKTLNSISIEQQTNHITWLFMKWTSYKMIVQGYFSAVYVVLPPDAMPSYHSNGNSEVSFDRNWLRKHWMGWIAGLHMISMNSEWSYEKLVIDGLFGCVLDPIFLSYLEYFSLTTENSIQTLVWYES